MMAAQKPIGLRYTSIDGFRQTWRGSTLKGARAWAHKWVGADAEVSTAGYAISRDGIGKLQPINGCTLYDLFKTGA